MQGEQGVQGEQGEQGAKGVAQDSDWSLVGTWDEASCHEVKEGVVLVDTWQDDAVQKEGTHS